MPIRDDVTREVSQLVREWKETEGLTPRQINDGYCSEFAKELRLHLGRKGVYGIETFEVTRSIGDIIRHPNSQYPYHVFLRIGGKYYDAETPQGAYGWKDLPIIREFLRKHGEKSVQVFEVQ